MIPKLYIEAWQKQAPWQTFAMVEQDLVISRALVELYKQPYIQKSLAFRGGTALNKLFIKPPARYSEDLDFVQINPQPIGETIRSIRDSLDHWLGEPKRKLTERSVKLIYRYQSINDNPARLKIEINTTEHFQVEPLVFDSFFVESEWFQGKAQITTYQLNELMATKLRALYQRRKGRDLFDLWYVLDNKLIDPLKVLSIFAYYCKENNENISRAMFEESLYFKEQNPDFRSEMSVLSAPRIHWNFEQASHLVRTELVNRLPGNPWQG